MHTSRALELIPPHVAPPATEGPGGLTAELAAVTELVDGAVAGGGALVLTGDADADRAALLDAAAGRAQHHGLTLLRGAGDPARAGVPFAVLAGLLRPLRPVSPDPAVRSALSGTPGPTPDRLRVGAATLAVLRAAGRERPVLVAVDDLQDADPDSAAALAFAARRLPGSRVAFLASVRTGDGHAVPSGLPELPVPPRDEPADRTVVALRPARATVHQLAAAAERRAAHRTVGRVLADPARVPGPAAAALDRAVRALVTVDDPAHITRVAAGALALDRVAECREPLRRVLDGGRAGHAVPAALTAAGLLATAAVATGRWDEVDALAAQGAALAGRTGHPAAAAPLLAQATVAAARGDEVRTRGLVDAALAAAGPRDAVADGTRAVLALVALGRGDAEDAYRHACAVTPPGRLAPGSTAALRVSFDLVEAAVQLDRREEARRHVQAMREAPLHAVSPRFAMLTAAAAGLVAGPEEAGACFAAALATPDADRWPFEQARIQLAYGDHLRRRRSVGPARALLGAALETFARLGARPWEARARHGLRATGVTVGRPAGPAAAAALTAEERRVVALAAAGLTNKQIARELLVSHHTVAARLYQIFPKLGVGSRAALRAALLTLDGAATADCTA